MNILVDIGHPGHVHFFKHFIREMRERGHEVTITARNKEMTLELLRKYHLDFIPVGEQQRGKLNLMKEWVSRDLSILRIAKANRVDLLMGIGNPSVAHTGRVLGARSIVFTDTEHAKFANQITFPFADSVCTPSCYLKDVGRKQVRYNGYHELAYLHPRRFTPDPSVLRELDLEQDQRLIIVRFVSWQASHDVGQHGIMDKVTLVQELERYGKVIITSEKQLPPELQRNVLKVSPEKLHDLLYYASLYVGEGATTASECAMLGTPAIYVNTLSLGYIAEEDDKYHLLSDLSRRPYDDATVMEEARRILEDPTAKQACRANRERMLADKCDVTSFMVQLAEGTAP